MKRLVFNVAQARIFQVIFFLTISSNNLNKDISKWFQFNYKKNYNTLNWYGGRTAKLGGACHCKRQGAAVMWLGWIGLGCVELVEKKEHQM